MTIINRKLWDAAPQSFRDHCRDRNQSLAFVALKFPDDHPQYPGQYKCSWAGPRKDAETVATNLETWL